MAHSPPLRTATGGCKGRRSWFDAPPLTTLNCPGNVEPTCPARKRRSVDSVENLTLTHFTTPPRIGFGTVVLGKTKVRTLLIRNPHDYEQEVIVERFPYKKKFAIEVNRFTVQPSEVFSLEISWSPDEAGGVREMIQFHINDVYRLQAFLFGSAEQPKQIKRGRKKNGLGPKVRQQQNVLQTPALANIASSYSPRRSEEAMQRLEEADRIKLENDKENSANFRSNEDKFVMSTATEGMSQGSGNANNTRECLRPRVVQQVQSEKLKFSESKAARTPTPLESTTIMPKLEKTAICSGPRGRKQWKGVSDGTSAILNTMSPILVNEGNEHGFTVDSYYQPNDTSVFKQTKLHSSHMTNKNGRFGETFAKPQLPLDAGDLTNPKNLDRRSTTTLPSSAFTSNVGKLMHPELMAVRGKLPQTGHAHKIDRTSLLGHTSSVVPKSISHDERKNIFIESPSKKSPRTSVLSPRTPRAQRQAEEDKLSQASPNTMLNESLSLISNMRLPNVSGCTVAAHQADESGSSSPTEMNASLSCSIISQGCGMVSPDSFMEDMKNASINFGHRDCYETTSTPNLPGVETQQKPTHNALSTSISGTPSKKRPPSSRFGSKRRSFTSQFQREQAKRVAAAVKRVKQDSQGLESVTTTKVTFQKNIKPVYQKKSKEIKDQNPRAAVPCDQQPKSWGDEKRVNSKKKSPPLMRSPTKRLRKEALVKQMKTKCNDQKETIFNPVISAPEKDSNHKNCDPLTAVKSRSYEANTVTKNCRSEDSNNQSRFFPDIFASEGACVDSAAADKSPAYMQLGHDGNKILSLAQVVSDAETGRRLEVLKSEGVGEIVCGDSVLLCQNKLERAVAAAERIPSSPLSSPKQFQPLSPTTLPTSPSGATLDGNRRATLTVTKSRPSDALLAAMKNRKRLFDMQSNNLNRTEEDKSEMHENVEVTVKERYEQREGKVYVVVKETTSVTKSTTDTYMEQVGVEMLGTSPGQFCTPSRLPSSPDPDLSRRSTHFLRSPKVIDKTGMKTVKLEFETGQDRQLASCQERSSEENLESIEDVLSKTKSDTFEKEPTILVDSMHLSKSLSNSNTFEKESSALLETSEVKSETFEKEPSTNLSLEGDAALALQPEKDVSKWAQVKPITAVCVMSTDLVDYGDIGSSEDGGSSGNLTKDSLDVTIHSDDSLDKSKALEPASLERAFDGKEELNGNCEMKPVPKNYEADHKAILEADGGANNVEENELGEQVLPTESDEEEDKFYDTLSQRYYDALSDTRDADLEEELAGVCDIEDPEDKFAGVCDRKDLEDNSAVVCEREDEAVKKIQLTMSRLGTERSTQPVVLSDSSPDHEESFVFDNLSSIDRKEQFVLQHRQVLEVKQREENVSRLDFISDNQDGNCESKNRLRRSLSANQLDQPCVFSVDISDVKKPPAPQKLAKPVSDKNAKHRSQSLSSLTRRKTSGRQTGEKTSAKSVVGVLHKKKQVGVPQSRLILLKKTKSGAPRHPMPFAARNMYYDERWMEKQERGFVQWLNFVLTPPDEYVAATKAKVNAGSLSLDAHEVKPQLAPTKEVLSFRAYAARRRLNRLRREACQMFQSEGVAVVIRKIEVEVESRRIAMRKDKMAFADLGIKQRMLDLLLQYSSLWLRVGLETIFGEILMLQSNQDILGLSRFIVTRLLGCPDIAAEFAHPTVPHLYKDGYADALSRHTVKKFLLLVYFLDHAKTSRLIEHDPCLFCKDAEIKSSKEILVQFSREVLSGEGDITRHLAYLGYKVHQSQRPIDEFDFAVRTLSSDLRDGLRLSRVMEFMAGEQGIMGRLRTPAISRLQKVHNTEEFFKAAQKNGLDLRSSGVSAKDVVDGHREKTLMLLWRVMLHFQSSIQVRGDKSSLLLCRSVKNF
ncbi:abnormal spindle-like microcephaly-associated protein homolog [Elysia marginata]|uniref:Abnormal spindle-like microcephaly-associated protein homolog n=1 Tax=Elysia marginata TaxID=1093978 RepID=A0AAV4FE98_9GAST|nr:abnormal spindle-like microcephaly-associated protein homolog [Elysia marginata]